MTKKTTATKLRIAESTDQPAAPAEDTLQARATRANFQLLKLERIAREAREKLEATKAKATSATPDDFETLKALGAEVWAYDLIATNAEREVNTFAQANSELWKEATKEQHQNELAALRSRLATNAYAETLGKIKACISAFTTEIKALVAEVDTTVADRSVLQMQATGLAQSLGEEGGFGQDTTKRIFEEFSFSNRPENHSGEIYSLNVFPRHGEDELFFNLQLGGMVK
jgi:hypothetical protein